MSVGARPPCAAGVVARARPAWVGILAAAAERAVAAGGSACAGLAPVAVARRLETAAFAAARAEATAGLVMPTAAGRAAAETAAYAAACRRVLAALDTNGPALLARHGDQVEVLLEMDTAHLVAGTEGEAWRARMDAERERARAILEEDDGAPAKEGILRCRRCRSYKLLYDVKQTRSADEPATVFWKCDDCGADGQLN